MDENLLDLWKEIYGQICGYNLEGTGKNIKAIKEAYEIPELDFSTAIFSIQTYYAIIIDTLYQKISQKKSSDASKLIFDNVPVFEWFKHSDSSEVQEVVNSVEKRLKHINLQDFENEAASEDILKDIYQSIFPKEIRHSHGEHYTPEWVVSLTLDSIGFDGKNNINVLDPAAGTGVFITEIINRVKKGKEFKSKKLLNYIIENIVGYELNPLAVLAARFNYWLSIRDLIDTSSNEAIKIPIYHADSLLGPRLHNEDKKDPEKSQQMRLDLKKAEEEHTEFLSPFFNFKLPEKILQTEERVKNNFQNLRDALFNRKNDSETPNTELFNKLQELDKRRAKVYINFIENTCLARASKSFDIVIGNPPWVSWDAMSDKYRNSIAEQWEEEKIFTQEGWRARVAAGKTDLSALFVYMSVYRFLKKNGKIAFVLPQNLFQNESGGEGFRLFETRSGIKFSPNKVIDLVDLNIFHGASNRPCIATFEKDSSVDYPVDYYKWTSGEKKNYSTEKDLEKVKSQMKIEKLFATPLKEDKENSPWISAPKSILSVCKSVSGTSKYKARGGVNTGGANAVFLTKILKKKNDISKIKNYAPRARKEVKNVTKEVESDLVRPLLRGKDVKRWYAEPSHHIFLPYDPSYSAKKALPESKLKEDYPKGHGFIKQFKDFLSERPEYHRWGEKGPYYEVYRIGPYTFSSFKVVWKHTGIGKRMRSAVIDGSEERTIPDQKVILIPFDDLKEAHYVCAMLNSAPIFLTLKKYLVMDASTHILNNINIPKWNPNSTRHNNLSQLSKKAHKIAEKKDNRVSNKLEQIEREIDKNASKIWGLSEEQLKDSWGYLKDYY